MADWKAPPPVRECAHHYCRCMAAERLASMGRMIDAMRCHTRKVRCLKAREGEK